MTRKETLEHGRKVAQLFYHNNDGAMNFHLARLLTWRDIKIIIETADKVTLSGKLVIGEGEEFYTEILNTIMSKAK